MKLNKTVPYIAYKPLSIVYRLIAVSVIQLNSTLIQFKVNEYIVGTNLYFIVKLTLLFRLFIVIRRGRMDANYPTRLAIQGVFYL